VDVCCFDKTGTITAENLVLEGVAGVECVVSPLTLDAMLIDDGNSPKDPRKLINVKETSRDTTLCLAAAHALVKLDDGTIVGDPMEKTTLDSLEWTVGKNESVHPLLPSAPHRTHITIKRRFQFSSALKRMSTISSLPNGRVLASVKGAPETLKHMLDVVPHGYEETYKWFTRNGSRVLALGVKEMDPMTNDKVRAFMMRGSRLC